MSKTESQKIGFSEEVGYFELRYRLPEWLEEKIGWPDKETAGWVSLFNPPEEKDSLKVKAMITEVDQLLSSFDPSVRETSLSIPVQEFSDWVRIFHDSPFILGGVNHRPVFQEANPSVYTLKTVIPGCRLVMKLDDEGVQGECSVDLLVGFTEVTRTLKNCWFVYREDWL